MMSLSHLPKISALLACLRSSLSLLKTVCFPPHHSSLLMKKTYITNCRLYQLINHPVQMVSPIGCLNPMHIFFPPLWHQFLMLRFKNQLYPPRGKRLTLFPYPEKWVPSDISKDLRRISLTSTLSKICERFVTDWLFESIRPKIDICQYVSIKNCSTTQALLSLVHYLLRTTDALNSVVRLFLLDFPKQS